MLIPKPDLFLRIALLAFKISLYVNIIVTLLLLLTNLSAARIHVPHQLAYLFLCAYALTGGWCFADPSG